jgi:hypothetical protein
VRPIGTRIGEARWTNTSAEIRNAVGNKAKKYGRLDRPLIVCVNVLDWSHRSDVLNALIGQEETVVTFDNDSNVLCQKPGRKPDGAFGSEERPRNRRVSAVAVVSDLTPWTMGGVTPELFHHPWPHISLSQSFWPMSQWIANYKKGRLETIQGSTAAIVLRLPDPWPVSME